ncbi:MAG: alpha-L-arabinofuranosidase [Planctomycetota bacterium]
MPKFSAVSRRQAIVGVGASVAAASVSMSSASAEDRADAASTPAIVVVSNPVHDLSPYLYMQFMEPLGATDGSIEASWDHRRNRWRPDLIRATKELGPTMMRWGGIFSDFYRWREAVGPRAGRKPMLNLLWGGIESNQIGTAEFVDFCRQVQADPLMCVNFESDGRERYMRIGDSVRTADAAEAAEWVAYCNDEKHPERESHGYSQPHRIRHWQLGNETSYDRNGFDVATACQKTIEFAKSMRKSDPEIELIGWGDFARNGKSWAPRMIEEAGEHLQYIAFHHMFNPDDRKNPVLGNLKYREDPDRTWNQLINAVGQHEQKIKRVRQTLPANSPPLALTECHFTISDRDRCDVLSSWAAGVAYARILNVHQRHGDILKIATAADYCGNRWQVNAVMLPTPEGKGDAFLMPVARVMSLYRHHVGKQHLTTTSTPDGLDVVASRTGDTIYLHVVNTRRTQSVRTRLQTVGLTPMEAVAYQVAGEPEQEITRFQSDIFNPVEKALDVASVWDFPPASVSAIEIKCS